VPKPEAADRADISSANRDFPAEQRDTEAAIRLWHRKASEVGGPPPLNTFDFSHLTGGWGYRFLISGDEFVKASVFLVYGAQFARLLGLPEQPRSKILLFHQLPARYQPLFVEGYGDALRNLAPTCLSGTVVHQRKLELYRAAFMPIQGENSVRPLIFGSFNYRVVPQEAVLDGFPTASHCSEAKPVVEHLRRPARSKL
jgi:hypothetical protein